MHRRNWIYSHRVKNPGVGKGGASKKGAESHLWKGGSSVWYQRKNMKPLCEDCGSHRRLEVHHKNEDRTDNRPSNLKTLCRTCHRERHGLGAVNV
jgi:5-methylcytosine-specific restriction endonuclease McrA